MIRIELDPTLAANTAKGWRLKGTVGEIMKDAVAYDYREKKATVSKGLLNTFGADLLDGRFVSYLTYLNHAYQNHHEIVLAPQHVWYTVLCEITTRIKGAPKTFESLFTTTPGSKQQIFVQAGWHGELPMDQIMNGLRERVPSNIDLFLPEFTTSTPMSRLAFQGAFADAMQVYYEYMMYLCGFPAVHLAGTEADWNRVASGLIDLMKLLGPLDDGLGEYLKTASERTMGVLACLREPDSDRVKEFLRDIYYDEKCGSGGQLRLSGWFLDLFLPGKRGNGDITNYPNHLSVVPYKQVEDGARFELVLGLIDHRFDGNLLVPEYGRVQLRVYEEPLVKTSPGYGVWSRGMTVEQEIEQLSFHLDAEAQREPGTVRVRPLHMPATVAA